MYLSIYYLINSLINVSARQLAQHSEFQSSVWGLAENTVAENPGLNKRRNKHRTSSEQTLVLQRLVCTVRIALPISRIAHSNLLGARETAKQGKAPDFAGIMLFASRGTYPPGLTPMSGYLRMVYGVWAPSFPSPTILISGGVK
jgi:hypothetical protein